MYGVQFNCTAYSVGVARGPGIRAGLSVDAVVAAAGELVDEVGAEALSMRRVAAVLGVAPNALYSHVADKAALVDLLLDDALGAVAAPDPAGDPVAELRAVMAQTYLVLLRRPSLVPLYLARQGSRGPHAVALGEGMDVLLERLGLGRAAAADARRVLIVHAIGFAAFATTGTDGPMSAARLRRNFDLGLDWLLEGITASVRP